ncbi:ADP-heptose--LPS heptosyltransferase I [Vibrio qinghaiensis]|uniref:ADP-heptose--LPS heptosyltransferase I n=1 Tax=Vibrio qinghaiensis TaxID=2025808 RepID=A0A223N0K7_9VIBR|nr:glycosyltransferase family 9 protein [Vibrio qinghaiensis]ASU23375.1 ADP-heptose--LPS heptosyltransferase I [Vibrio qinghaiensis]
MPFFKQAPHSICFLRLSAIGDVCHAVAAIQTLQRYWPSTKITWVIGKVEAQLLQGLENVELIVFEKKQGFSGMRDVWKQLKGRRFDALVHMQLALRASLLTLGIKATYKIGFNFKRAKEGQWLFTNCKISDTESTHVLDSFYSFIEFLGVPRSTPQWDLPIDKADHQFASTTLGDKPTLVISPAASKDERNWLSERYAIVGDYAFERGYQVVICGSPAEREKKLANDIISQMRYPALNLVGSTTLKQLTAVLSKASIVLAPDSGPVHIATTQGTPVIGLYGHSNPKRTGPYNNLENVVSVYEKFIVQQHGKTIDTLPWSTRVKGEHIMKAISVNAVIRAFDCITKENQYV